MVFSEQQLKELVNSPNDLVGAFTSQSIADVIYSTNTEVLSRFIQVPPLQGENGQQNAIWKNYNPLIGGYIPSNSIYGKEVFEVMDIMLSEEGGLISRYGEKAVDWNFSEEGDLSTYGTNAEITTINYLNDQVENKTLKNVGPQIIDEKYVNGVTWNGNNSLIEYIDARAVKSYEKYYSKNAMQTIDELNEKYTDEQISNLIREE